ncbi:MAG TPA: FAD-binding oxidoreductase [Longimicrobiales bacterium]
MDARRSVERPPRGVSRAGAPVPAVAPAPVRPERVTSWGGAVAGEALVFRPGTWEEVDAAIELARRRGRSVAFRGAGRSYGDAALATGHVLVDLGRLRSILAWDPERGIIDVEPGVTIHELWCRTLPDGWWPPVVPGTAAVTVGGAAAMNVHGKNHWNTGCFGDHVLEFEIVLPSGERRVCDRSREPDLFHAAIGGFGMFGHFTRLRLGMRRVGTGYVDVRAFPTRDLPHALDVFEEHANEADFLVGWLDGFARGERLGRGIVHRADHASPGPASESPPSLRPEYQLAPRGLLRVLPRSQMWRLLRLFRHRPGMRLLNATKHAADRIAHRGSEPTQQPLASFSFLLDALPNWERCYRPGGLIQVQAFVPAAAARSVFTAQLRLSQARGLPPYLAVLKRHREDPFLIRYAIDGYSLALDYPVTRRNGARLRALIREMNERVFDAGGRFYFAKDAVLERGSPSRFLPPDRLERFLELKRRYDPEGLVQSDLSRRLFGDFGAAAGSAARASAPS